jgi:hypothetical protein
MWMVESMMIFAMCHRSVSANVALSVESSYAGCCEHVLFVARLAAGGRSAGTHS